MEVLQIRNVVVVAATRLVLHEEAESGYSGKRDAVLMVAVTATAVQAAAGLISVAAVIYLSD